MLGCVAGGFTGWAEHMPGLQYRLALPHGSLPGYDVTYAASLLALIGCLTMITGWYRLGGAMTVVAAFIGFFGADQLWVTAACILFCGAVLALFSPNDRSPGQPKSS